MSARRRLGAHAACALAALVAVLLVARAPWPPGIFPKYLGLAGERAAAAGRAADISPLYGALAGVLGDQARDGLLWLQCVLHALVAVSICEVVGRLAGARAGLLAGLAAALYPPLLVHAGIHEPETLVAALLVAGLLALEVARGRTRLANALPAAAGLCAGLAALGRPHFVLLVPAWAACAAGGAGAGRRSRAALALVVAAMIPLVAAGAARRGGGEGLVVMNPGPVLYEGNAPGVSGLTRHAPLAVRWIARAHPESIDHAHVAYRQVASAADGRPLGIAEVNAWWTRLTLDGIRATPRDALARFMRKAVMALSPRELHDLAVAEQLQRRVQAVLPWGFGLAVVGLAWLPFCRRERLVQLAAPLCVTALSWLIQVAFYCSARQKLPMAIAFLVITPVLAVDAWRGALRIPLRRPLALALAAGLVLALAGASGRWSALDADGWTRAGARQERGPLAALAMLLDGRLLVPRGDREDAAALLDAIDVMRSGGDARGALEALAGRGLDATMDDSTVAVPELWLALALEPGDPRGAALAREALRLRPADPFCVALARSRGVLDAGRPWPPAGCDPVSAACLMAHATGDAAGLRPWLATVPELEAVSFPR